MNKLRIESEEGDEEDEDNVIDNEEDVNDDVEGTKQFSNENGIKNYYFNESISVSLLQSSSLLAPSVENESDLEIVKSDVDDKEIDKLDDLVVDVPQEKKSKKKVKFKKFKNSQQSIF